MEEEMYYRVTRRSDKATITFDVTPQVNRWIANRCYELQRQDSSLNDFTSRCKALSEYVGYEVSAWELGDKQ